MDLEKFLTDAARFNGPFRLRDLPDADHVVDQYLEDSGLFFWTFDNWGSKQYLLKENFFDGSLFTVHLASQEINQQFLCAPGRFLPFTSGFPSLTINGQAVPMKKKRVSPACLKTVYSLDKGRNFIRYIQENSDSWIFDLDSANCETNVYDLSDFDLKSGSHLQLKIRNGRLSGKIFGSEDIDIKKVSSWCSMMEKSMCGVLQEFGPCTDVLTQLEQAYFYGPEKLRKIQAPAFRDFITLSSKLSATDFIFNRIIWFKGKSPAHSVQVKNEAYAALEELRSLKVSFGFYSMLNEELQSKFKTDNLHLLKYLPKQKYKRSFSTQIRTIAMWLINSRRLLKQLKNLPVEESLMLIAAFRGLQSLCDIYRKGGSEISDNFFEAFKVNIEIIKDLTKFFQMCFISENK